MGVEGEADGAGAAVGHGKGGFVGKGFDGVADSVGFFVGEGRADAHFHGAEIPEQDACLALFGEWGRGAFDDFFGGKAVFDGGAGFGGEGEDVAVIADGPAGVFKAFLFVGVHGGVPCRVECRGGQTCLKLAMFFNTNWTKFAASTKKFSSTSEKVFVSKPTSSRALSYPVPFLWATEVERTF